MNKKNFRTIYYKFRTLSEIQDISGQIIKNQEYQENQDCAHPCYLKGIVSVCFRCPARTVGFSGTRLYLINDQNQHWKLNEAASQRTSCH